MSSVAYIMQWGDHKTNVHNHLRVLFEEQKFVDLTLFCSTHSVKVHSIVIASNSSYFEKVLLSQNGVNSVIVLKDMKFEVLRALIEFMYCGETTVLDEDVDALLYASKKFEVKGLSRMTRQGVMFSTAEKIDNEAAKHSHSKSTSVVGAHAKESQLPYQDACLARTASFAQKKFIFPAESAQPGMIQAVIDLTKNQTETPVLENKKVESLYFKKTVFQRRGRPHKKKGHFGFPEVAMSDTEYAILKEAEESRKALEKLQKYVLSPKEVLDRTTGTQVQAGKLGEPFFFKNSKNQTNQEDHSYSNSKHSVEDEIAAGSLSNELNQQSQNEIFGSAVLPTDVPIFVDDGKGNYVTLDVEMANMIAGQEYNLVQGVVMAGDGIGSQHSNPASILIPEDHFNPESMPILTCGREVLGTNLEVENSIKKSRSFGEDNDEISSSTDSGNSVVKRKPFIVKEIIKVKQAKKHSEKVKISGRRDNREGVYLDRDSLVKFDNSGIRGIMF